MELLPRNVHGIRIQVLAAAVDRSTVEQQSYEMATQQYEGRTSCCSLPLTMHRRCRNSIRLGPTGRKLTERLALVVAVVSSCCCCCCCCWCGCHGDGSLPGGGRRYILLLWRRRRQKRRRYAWSPIHDPRLLNWVVIRAGHAPTAARPAGGERSVASVHLSHDTELPAIAVHPSLSRWITITGLAVSLAPLSLWYWPFFMGF